MSQFQVLGQIALVGVGATAVMDSWLWLLSRLGIPTTSFAMVGRWVGHVAQGRLSHPLIAKAAPIRHELGLGWLTHYLIGIAYAGLLVAAAGAGWLREPRLLPALALGLVTVAAPWLVMQPAMGAGVLASKTPRPLQNCLRNLANHAVFGIGLYLAAALLDSISR